MLNNIILQGRLTRDPELRYTGTGKAVCSFSLAVERDAKDANGDRCVDFIDCTAWGKTAEMISKYYHKGSTAIVEGRLQINDWTDSNGNRRRNAVVNLRSIYFGDRKRDDQSAPAASGSYADFEDDGEYPF